MNAPAWHTFRLYILRRGRTIAFLTTVTAPDDTNLLDLTTPYAPQLRAGDRFMIREVR